MDPSIPKGARLFSLQPHKKIPFEGTRGHLDAVPAEDFTLVGNYGIALDNQWLLVDVDRPDDPIAVEWGARLPETWTQKTARGTHRLYKLPADFTGKNARFPAGDLKVKGYLVGPGSEVDGKTYYTLDERPPVDAPAWLLELVSSDRPNSTLINGELVFNERDRIAIGENDVELFSMASGMRRRGFTEEAIFKYLKGVVASGIVDQVPGNEYADKDLRRLARSAARYDPETDIGPFLGDNWFSAEDISLIGPIVRWWVHGFVPRGELVLVYGEGGVGKSSWASWLAASITRRGGKFVFIGVEEPFQRFAARSIIGGADRSKLFAVPDATNIVLPRDAATLKEQIVASQADVVYFDSIYSHFNSVNGENAAERARKALGPLAELAQSTGCTIIGVFHKNKGGDYLGSTEMRNVPRYLLEASRQTAGPLRIRVDKTNLYDNGKAMQFFAHDEPFHDPETGRVQMEEKEDGSIEPMTLKVLERGPDLEDFSIEDLDTAAQDREQAIKDYVEQDPDMSATDIWSKVGGRKQDVLALVKALKATGSQ